ncbi:MAG: hypothetical protein DRH37_04335 [Deltaproteobacteria bacterium]|nr:MAG: hypothetical protein DRH37_04335 [Deltaproteobacteria bacterium]
MKVYYIAIAFAIFIGAVVARISVAADLRVERDGTGDFATIQAAVDAAADGDRILIGPGRYDERAVVTTPGWSLPVYVLVQKDNISLIGAGNGQTIIGQAGVWDISQPWTRGIEAGTDWGSNHLYVEGIRFENIAYAISGHPGPNLDVLSCEFAGNHYGVFSVGPVGVSVRSSQFSDLASSGLLLYSSANLALTVQDCLFALDPANPLAQTAVQVQGTASILFETSEFTKGAHGLNVVGGGATVIQGCTFTAHKYESVRCGSCSEMGIAGCSFLGSGYALAINQGQLSAVSMTNSAIEDVVDGSVALSSVRDLRVSNCILDRGRQYVVDQYSFCDKTASGLPHLDFRNNDWGTTDADSIEAWIHTCDYVVDYVPFVGQPVANEHTSWGALKAIFR